MPLPGRWTARSTCPRMVAWSPPSRSLVRPSLPRCEWRGCSREGVCDGAREAGEARQGDEGRRGQGEQLDPREADERPTAVRCAVHRDRLRPDRSVRGCGSSCRHRRGADADAGRGAHLGAAGRWWLCARLRRVVAGGDEGCARRSRELRRSHVAATAICAAVGVPRPGRRVDHTRQGHRLHQRRRRGEREGAHGERLERHELDDLAAPILPGRGVDGGGHAAGCGAARPGVGTRAGQDGRAGLLADDQLERPRRADGVRVPRRLPCRLRRPVPVQLARDRVHGGHTRPVRERERRRAALRRRPEQDACRRRHRQGARHRLAAEPARAAADVHLHPHPHRPRLPLGGQRDRSCTASDL